MRAINCRTVTMSLSPSCRNWPGCYLSWKEVTGQRPQSPGGLFNHREWALIPPLNTKFELLPQSFMHHAVKQLTVSSLPRVARFSLWTLLHVIATQRCCWTGQTQTQTSTWTYRSWWCLQLLPSLISNFKIRILNVYFFSHFPDVVCVQTKLQTDQIQSQDSCFQS